MVSEKDYKTWLGKLSLYTAFFCSILPHASRADDDMLTRWQKKAEEFLSSTALASSSSAAEPAPWQLRAPAGSPALPEQDVPHPGGAAALDEVSFKSFLVASHLSPDYLTHSTVMPISYSSGINAHAQEEATESKKAPKDKLIGYLDDPDAPVYRKKGRALKLVKKDTPSEARLAKLETVTSPDRKTAPTAKAVKIAKAITVPVRHAAAILPDDQVTSMPSTARIAAHRRDPMEVKTTVAEPIDRTKEGYLLLSRDGKTTDTLKAKPTETVSAAVTPPPLPWLVHTHVQMASSAVAAVPTVPVTTATIEPLKDERSAIVVAENDGQNALPAVLLTLPQQSTPGTPLASRGTGLSTQSRDILKKLPADVPPPKKPEELDITHTHKNALEQDEVKKHNGIGIEMSVRKPKANISRMLEDAYNALIAGNQEEAVHLYKDVLKVQPANKLGLFGLATTYHRAGQIQLARPLYGKLLAIDPHNVEGLNNFLVLLSDEDPKDALVELDKLEKSHPGFSPIPAQMAIIYEKTGNYELAMEKMSKALALSPENLKYRYDMAIILDKKGDWTDAAVFYKQLLTAIDRGEKVSASSHEIQQRLTFIQSNRPKG